MSVSPVRSADPVFGSWLDRRRASVEAQMKALEEERYGDLVALITKEDEDRPPPPPTSMGEREAYQQVLTDSRELTERMLKVRGRILEELRGIERRRSAPLPSERRSGRGGSLDGYL